jgi:glucokinase
MDIGGSFIRYEVVEAGAIGQIRITEVSLDEVIDSFISSFGITKVGISIAAQVRDGYILSSPNIKIKHKNLKEYIKKRWKIEAVIENDLHMAAVAEANYWGEENLVAIYSGTGLGAGVIIENKLLKGANSSAGEIGHIPYKEAPFRCGCGKKNCIELFASGVGLAKWAKHYEIELKLLRELLESDYKAIAKEYEKALIKACATMVTIFNPGILVLGGGIIEDNRYLVELIRTQLPKYALKASVDNLRVELTKLYDAPLTGMKLTLGLELYS